MYMRRWMGTSPHYYTHLGKTPWYTWRQMMHAGRALRPKAEREAAHYVAHRLHHSK